MIATLAGMGFLSSCAREQNEPVVEGIVAVPLFLTEDDARTIARVEAQKRGVLCIGKGQTLALAKKQASSNRVSTIQYTIDEFDKSKRVGFEFVTRDDCEEVYGRHTAVTTKELAEEVQHSVDTSGLKGRIKVIELAPDEKSEDKTRKEVVSFLTWLKKEGVI